VQKDSAQHNGQHQIGGQYQNGGQNQNGGQKYTGLALDDVSRLSCSADVPNSPKSKRSSTKLEFNIGPPVVDKNSSQHDLADKNSSRNDLSSDDGPVGVIDDSCFTNPFGDVTLGGGGSARDGGAKNDNTTPTSRAFLLDTANLPLSDMSDMGGITTDTIATPISHLFHPRSEEDIRAIVARGVFERRRVGIRGTRHSMGGHSLAAGTCSNPGNFEIDLLRMKRQKYFASSSKYTHPHLVCEPGCLWSEVIEYLNQYGKSPRTMQSYSTFSVGGTISVNAHGITTDFCFAESVLEFRLVKVRQDAGRKIEEWIESTQQQQDGIGSSPFSSASSPSSSLDQLLDSLVEVVICKRSDLNSLNQNKNGNGNQNDDRNLDEPNLFSLALGGYGLFGVITEVTLRVSDNIALEVDGFQLDCAKFVDYSAHSGHDGRTEFERVYHKVRGQSVKTAIENGGDISKTNKKADDKTTLTSDDRGIISHNINISSESQEPAFDLVDIKLARLNILTLNTVTLYIFKRASRMCTKTPDLGLAPRVLSWQSQLLYKWAMPTMQNSRFALEERTGQALDWSDSDGATRNQMLFESAEPLAKLYNPLFCCDDTFILQEYFVPKERFAEWIVDCKPIYLDLEKNSEVKHCKLNDKKRDTIILLNTTIRYVEHDTDTFLRYAQNPTGVFAFVLYYRIARTPSAEQRLGEFHDRFAEKTLALGGTFYLPYRKCYSPVQLKRAYPMIGDFCKLKTKHDPLCTFSNQWYEHYLWRNFADKDWKIKVEKWYSRDFERPVHGIPSSHLLQLNAQAVARGLGISIVANSSDVNSNCDINDTNYKTALLYRNSHPQLHRRVDSYRRLMRDPDLRKRFHKQFLVKIFNVQDKDDVFRTMGRAIWDPKNTSDQDIFRDIRAHYHGNAAPGTATAGGRNNYVSYSSGSVVNESPLAKLSAAWRGLRQLSRQKTELTRQTVTILTRLGKLNTTRSICSIGDHGKLCLSLIKVLGEDQVDEVLIINDSKLNELDNLVGVLEKGTLNGKMCAHERFLLFDYMADENADPRNSIREKFKGVASNSLDLVTINQGLHHIPVEKLESFIKEVTRILAPGGVFIFREHDMRVESSLDSEEKSQLCHLGHAPIEMLDLAHSVFNAVTGASERDERDEIRAFRSIQEWRVLVGILSNNELEDGMLYDIEEGDCTWDEMICFVKRAETVTNLNPDGSGEALDGNDTRNPSRLSVYTTPRESRTNSVSIQRDLEPPVLELIRALLGQVPGAAFKAINEKLQYLAKDTLPPLIEKLRNMLTVDIPHQLMETDKQSLERARWKAEGSNPLTAAGEKSTKKTGAAKIAVMVAYVEPMISGFLEQVIDISERLLIMLDNTEIQEAYDFQGLLKFPELFLIIPWIQNRVRYIEKCKKENVQPVLLPDGVGEMEKTLFQTFKDYAPMFLMPESSPQASKEETAASQSSVGTHGAHQQPSGRTAGPSSSPSGTGSTQSPNKKAPRGMVVGGLAPAIQSGRVYPSEILRWLDRLERAIPTLMSPETIQNAGLNLRQQSALAAQFGGRDRQSFAENIAWYLADERFVWNAMCVGFLEIEQTKVKPTLALATDDSRQNSPDRDGGRTTVTHNAAGDQNSNSSLNNHISSAYSVYRSPWHRVIRAFLRCERVNLTAKGQMGLRIIGLGHLVTLYNEVKAEVERMPNNPEKQQRQSMVNKNSFAALQEADPAFGKVSTYALNLLNSLDNAIQNVKKVELRFEGRSFHHLSDVGRIISATFGYTSLTSSPTDITMELRRYHEDMHLNPVLDVASLLMNMANRFPGDDKITTAAAAGNNLLGGSTPSTPSRNSKTSAVKAILNNASDSSQESLLTQLFLPGSLYVTEYLLTEFRNKASGLKRGMDDARKNFLKVATLGTVGSNVFTLEYVMVDGGSGSYSGNSGGGSNLQPVISGSSSGVTGTTLNTPVQITLESYLLTPAELSRMRGSTDQKVISQTNKHQAPDVSQALGNLKKGVGMVKNGGREPTPHSSSSSPDSANLASESTTVQAPNPLNSSSPYTSIFHLLSQLLTDKKLYKKLHYNQDGQYTWFKLAEWLQVEILVEFGRYLDHTPWFRFPFFGILQTYFSVLGQQCQIVSQKYGLATAFASSAFVTDLVPGIVMGWIFAQMSLFAKPLLMALPDYDKGDQDKLCEQIVLYLPEPVNDWSDMPGFFSGTPDQNQNQSNSSSTNFGRQDSNIFRMTPGGLTSDSDSTPTGNRTAVANQSSLQNTNNAKTQEREMVESCVEEVIRNTRRKQRGGSQAGGSQSRISAVTGTNQANTTPMCAWFQQNVDTRIQKVEQIALTSGTASGPAAGHQGAGQQAPAQGSQLLILTTPPFKPFGECLFRLALRFPAARVLELSNQPEVQIKISMDVSSASVSSSTSGVVSNVSVGPGSRNVSNWEQIKAILLSAGGVASSSGTTSSAKDVSISCDYTMLGRRYVAFCVKCPTLLAFMRRVAGLHPRVRLEQVYDFWT